MKLTTKNSTAAISDRLLVSLGLASKNPNLINKELQLCRQKGWQNWMASRKVSKESILKQLNRDAIVPATGIIVHEDVIPIAEDD